MANLEPTAIKDLKGRLEEEKTMLEKELSQFAKPSGSPGDYATTFDNLGDDREDNATEVEEYADNVALEDNLEKQLQEVNEALGRIAAGTYGICSDCGKSINLDRLRAYPAARTCIKCK